MNRILRFITAAGVYLCLGTVLTLLIVGLTMWGRGMLGKDRVYDILAVLYGRDLATIAGNQRGVSDVPVTQTSYEQIVEDRVLHALNMDLRETAMDKALIDLRQIDSDVRVQKERFSDLRESFERRLDELDNIAKDQALQEVKKTLEVMHPKQAKQQLLSMLEEGSTTPVVAIVKSIALDKRKKIFAEFKTDQEQEKLSEILREIRLGTGQGDLIRDTREQVEQFSPQKK